MRTKLTKITLAASILLAMVFTFISCANNEEEGGGGASCSINGRTVKIGTQTWMAENLNCNVSGSVCYGNDPANCAKYGRLYDWATAMGIDEKYNSETWNGSDIKHRGICPSGWHIPSDDDLGKLIDYVKNDKGCTDCADKYLKSKSGWYNNGNGEDIYGFSALPGGYGESGGYFGDVGYAGYWWSTSKNSIVYAYYWGISDHAYYRFFIKSSLRSVRCLMD